MLRNLKLRCAIIFLAITCAVKNILHNRALSRAHETLGSCYTTTTCDSKQITRARKCSQNVISHLLLKSARKKMLDDSLPLARTCAINSHLAKTSHFSKCKIGSCATIQRPQHHGLNAYYHIIMRALLVSNIFRNLTNINLLEKADFLLVPK